MRSEAFAVGSLVFLLLAGCAADSTPSDGDPNVLRPGDLDPAGDRGFLRGTVLTQEGLPVPQAQVGLQGTSLVAVTDASGVFLLRDLDPGTYTLLVGKLGFEPASQRVEVTAGQLAEVTVPLSAIAVTSAVYAETYNFAGFFECALATEVWISACSYPYTAAWGASRDAGANLSTVGVPPDVQRNVHRFNITIEPHIGQFVGELSWQAVSAASTRMMFLVLCGDYDPVWDECYEGIRYGDGGGFQGESPVRVVIPGSEFVEAGNGSEKYDLTRGDPVWIMNYIGLPWGDPQLAFQQRFDVWDTVFYNGPGPEGYTILEDE